MNDDDVDYKIRSYGAVSRYYLLLKVPWLTKRANFRQADVRDDSPIEFCSRN